jgi:ribonuclease HI
VLKFKASLGRGTNNFAELMALKLTLVLVAEKGVTKIQIFEDSLVVINWSPGGVNILEKKLLRPIFEEVQNLKAVFNCASFHHVYIERNELADGLSKAGLLLDPGQWHIWEQ